MKATGAWFIFLLLGASAFADDAPKKSKPKFTISKETTFVTEPVDKDGYIDYAAALNARLGKGVTPENNANVLIWKALGPRPGGSREMPVEYFRLMGIEQPRPDNEYFVDVSRFATEHLKLDSAQQNALVEKLLKASRRPWEANDIPLGATWLKANEKPLATIVEASKRPLYFNPLVPPKSQNASFGLIESLLSSTNTCRFVAAALACRAMLHTGEERYDEAWQDLLACHRLARLVARGGTLIEALLGIKADEIACIADLGFLERAKLGSKAIEKCQNDLQALPSLPAISQKVDLGERFVCLEMITLVDRRGRNYLNRISGKPPIIGPDRFLTMDMNWDIALQNANRFYDQLVDTLRDQEPNRRASQIAFIAADLKAKDLAGKFEEMATAMDEGGDVPETMCRLIGGTLHGLVMPAVTETLKAADRAEQTQRNLHLAFALAAYQREHGKYPEKLDALAPKYLAKIPDDYFTGKPLVYRPNEKGYLLYSFGPNGKDDDGKGREDDVGCDDISVRMPLPTPAKK